MGELAPFRQHLERARPEGHRHFDGKLPRHRLLRSCRPAFNNNETKTEVFEDARLSLDASKVFWGKPGIWDAYVGYRYWYNKFGTNHNAFLFSTIAPGTSIESTAYVGTTYHFK